MFSIAPLPLPLIAIAVAGLAFGQETASGEVMAQLGGMMGQDGGSTTGRPSERSSQAQVARKSGTCGVGLLGQLPQKSAYWRAPVITLPANSGRPAMAALAAATHYASLSWQAVVLALSVRYHSTQPLPPHTLR